MASASRCSDASSRASDTFIGYAVASSAMARTACGWRAAHSSAISEPMLWPNTSTGARTPAAATSAMIQSAIASTVASGAPALRLWPGRSTASTANP